MKKILSVFISFCLLFSSLMPAWASRADTSVAEDLFSVALERAALSQKPSEIRVSEPKQIQNVIRYQQADLFASLYSYPQRAPFLMTDLLAQCQQSASSAAKGKDIWQAEVQVNNWYVNAGQYMQVCLDMALEKGWTTPHVTPDARAKHFPEGQNRLVVQHIKEAGVSETGAPRAYRYLTGLLNIKDLCDQKDTDTNRRPYESQCEVAAEALEGLAIIGMQYSAYKAKAAESIYRFMADKNRSKMGQGAVYQGALLLLAVGAHGQLQKFLQEHAHQTGGGRFLHEIGYLSFEGIAKAIHENKDYTLGEYLNSYTARYSYLDRQLGDELIGKGVCAVYANAIRSVQNQYQCPYGNLYEELGMAIAQDSSNKQTASLAQWIWSRNDLPAPLITGLLIGGNGKWTYEKGGAAAQKALYGLLSADYTDLNEGSQRRLKMMAAEALEYHGVEGVKKSDYLQRDQSKFFRYSQQQWNRTILGMMDLTAAVVLLPRLLLSLGTLGLKGLSALSKITRIRNVSKWGGKMTQLVVRSKPPVTTPTPPRNPVSTQASATASVSVNTAKPIVEFSSVAESKAVSPAPSISATGEASMQMALTEEKAAASISRMQSQLSQFSMADKQSVLRGFRSNLAQEYQLSRQMGTKVTLVQRENALYKAFQPVFQAQKEAVYYAELDELARAYTAVPFKTGRVITHIPWRVRFSTQMSFLWQDLKAGLKGSLTDPRGFGAMMGIVGVGDPAFTLSTTIPGATSRGLATPIVMVADYAGGMGSKLTTLRSTVAPGLNAPRNLGMSVWSSPLSNSVVSPFSKGTVSFVSQVGPRVLFPLGVTSFSGQFDNSVVAAAYQQNAPAADGLFALRGKETLLVGVNPSEPKKFDSQAFQSRLLPLLRTGFVLGMNGFLAKWTEEINTLRLSQKITEEVEKTYEQALASVPNGDEEAIEKQFREILLARMAKGDFLAEHQTEVFKVLGWSMQKTSSQQASQAQAQEQEEWRKRIESNISQRQQLVDKWRGVIGESMENFLANGKLLAQATQDIAAYYHLERNIAGLKKEYSSKYGSKEAPLPEVTMYNEPSIFSITYRSRVISAYHDLLQKQAALETELPEREYLENKRRETIELYDEVVYSWVTYPQDHALSGAPALRRHLKELGENEASFSALQRQEYEELEEILYSRIFFEPDESIAVQNRMVMFPQVEKTAHSVFLIGDEFSPKDIWGRKTALGFFHPVFVQNASVEEALKHFLPSQENVLLVHGHGGINKHDVWKAPLVWSAESIRPEHSLSASELMKELALTPSKHTSVYMNACFSGHFLDELKAPAMQDQYAETFAHTDFYITASRNQRTMPEDLPAEYVQGNTRQMLFGKVLQRMRFNGDGLAARVLVDGKEIYPLAESVKRLEKEAKGLFASREKKKLLHALKLLLKLANATSQEEVMDTVFTIEKEFMGHVIWFGDSREDGFAAYSWGIDEKDYAELGFEFPFIVLEKTWVDYVFSVAEELFGQVGSIPSAASVEEEEIVTPAVPSYTKEDFKSTFYSETSKYVFDRLDLSQPLFAVPDYFSTAPVLWPGEESIAALKRSPADLDKYFVFKSEVEALRKEMSTALYYVKKNVNLLEFSTRSEFQDRLADLRSELHTLQRWGLELNSVEDWLNFALETLTPKIKGQYMDLPVFSRPDREYDSYKFFLYNTVSDASLRRTSLQAESKLFPKGLRVAVINDTPEILVRYKNLFTQTPFLERENWSFYTGLTDFSKAVNRGEKFDLIITDLNFSDGGASYIVAYLRNEGNFDVTIIAASSMPEAGLDEFGISLFERGFDGYLSSIHMSREDGGLYLITALNNYFRFKEQGNWAR